MSRRRARRRAGLRLGVLVVVVTFQAVGIVFFLGDVATDVVMLGLDPHTTYEAIATVALLLGVSLGGVELWRAIRRTRRAEHALRLASGAFAEYLEQSFEVWGLTVAEADVALLTLKGFDGPEIAALRGSAPGTVRAQLAHIYAKSGVTGRGQFVSLFIDALLDQPLPANGRARQGAKG